ncbi:hypothetical protein X805_27500 [Sphaerotilus natans subsp. natans DSM 6575]|uniref:Type I restriction modification DNA specificity domain-containing protein n=1 Tax=Sphaerotilus natans subsp. natans DSM 6575 TaxID=1286631 RepID=A0A059KKB0_9BURK|nr:restriction endonuclease subunit S [Sphaerotilus natans]KDB51649.1 hypothetical protein X805_27500 [Sphaerotilus natans subsp. natans DSM 6575]
MSALITPCLPLLADAPDGIKKLRGLILDLAVGGRLLWAEGVGAFDSPKRALRTLVDPSRPITYGVLKPGLDVSDGVRLVKTENVFFNKVVPNFRSRISTALDEEYKRTRLRGGEVLVTLVGSIGRCAIATADLAGANLSRSVGLIALSPEVDAQYLVYVLTSLINEEFIEISCSGTAQKVLNVGTLNNLEVPLPSLAEQHRIVAKVDELMALCDRLEARQQDAEAAHARLVQALLDSLTQARDAQEFQAGWERLAGEFSSIFSTESSIAALRQTIMSLAMRGYLTQGADHVAKVLSLSDLTTKITDGTHKTPNYVSSGVKFLSAKNVRTGILDMQECRYISEAEHIELTKRCRPEIGDILLSKSGSIGTAVIVKDDEPFSIFESLALLKTDHGKVLADYLQLAVQEACLRLDDTHVKGVGVKHLHLNVIRRIEVYTPTLDMQRRIVAKVSELLALCDQLKARIAAGRVKQAQLAEALVKQAVAAAG